MMAASFRSTVRYLNGGHARALLRPVLPTARLALTASRPAA